MIYKYTDEYLSQGGVITELMENRAINEVEQYKLTNPYYIEKLTILRTYIICCLENQTQENDLYEIKLKHYKDEFKNVLSEAKTDFAITSNADKNNTITAFNCPLLRG